jgi:flagellar motor switch protein FliN/FliY
MANAKQEKIVEMAAFSEPLPAVQGATTIAGRSAALLKDVQVTLEFRLGEATISAQQLFSLHDGAVIELARAVDDPVDVLLNGKLIARGQLVAAGDQFGVQVTEIIAVDAE